MSASDLSIIQHIERFVSLKEDEKHAFSLIVEERRVKRRAFIVQPGFICRHQSHIVKGAMDTVIQQIAYEKVEEICEAHPRFERFFRLVAQKAFAYSQRRALSNIGKTAEERYLEYAEMYPQFIQRVPQYVLSSYLGMSAEFLSKIRKKLATQS